jgi:hypothetical protein
MSARDASRYVVVGAGLADTATGAAATPGRFRVGKR